ncbi:uncharacterized protein At2g29880-like isoform X2 [Momordica charantia]|uniref:Uncharacterized protein At2g29880-like isoform X2 n=1 Tax=Momordica charantia TaxID=3673 RepID=A0A6J1DJY9_MOMCH|nr:uncharacterized protein At2g29880-like isoform X2 [Momordica charantia]
MLVAKDSVWDVSVERNPDARLLRGTVIENYDELCIIIGYDNPSESSLNPANVNLDLTANNEAINAGVVCYNQSNNAAEKENFITWTEEMDTCLSKLLVEQVVLGNRIEETFKTAAYTAALTVLNERFALDLTKENIRSRLNTWEKQYGRVKLLLSHDGFEWDERHKMVVANDFDWTAYIKKHPDDQDLRAKSIDNYNELCMIFGNEQRTGGWSIGGKHNKDRGLNDQDHTVLRVGISDDAAESGDSSSGADSMEASSKQTRTRPSSSSHSRKSLK